MTIHPQPAAVRLGPGDDTVPPSTPCASRNEAMTWEDAPFSTIHNPYYSYS
ncbi:MAG TPA: hypothetical protein VK960_05925 [Acidimicrobiia bacterium]|nr:hypothetical protein [Acidimicrobiia bacterium]